MRTDTVSYVQGRTFTQEVGTASAVADVHIRCISASDTLVTTSTADGSFFFSRVRPGKKLFLATKVGFHPALIEMNVLPGDNALMIKMAQNTENITPAFLSASVSPITRRGDTLIYHPAAVKTMEGDNAIEILRQMPGVEIKDKTIFINGQKVERAYVNGLLIFGNDPMSPVNAILADDVRQIKTYEEQSIASRRSGDKNGKKDRVLDIITKEPVISAWDGYAQLAGGGEESPAEDGSIQGRYSAGINANFFSEKFLTYGNIYSNNLGIQSNTINNLEGGAGSLQNYHQKSFALIGMQKFWGDRLLGSNINVSYSYSNDAQRNYSRTKTTYSEQDYPLARIVLDSTMNRQNSGIHQIELISTINNKNLKLLRIISRWDIRNNDNTRAETQCNRIGSSTEYLASEIIGDIHNTLHTANYLEWENPISSGIFKPKARLSFLLNPQSGESWTIDTLPSSLYRRYITASSSNRNMTLDASVGTSIKLFDKEALTANASVSYSAGYKRNSKWQLAYDLYDTDGLLAIPDTNYVNTFNFSKNYFYHGPQLGFSIYRNNLSLEADFSLEMAEQGDSESFPTQERVTHGFILPYIDVLFVLKTLNIKFFSRPTIPAVEQYRDRLDDSNPMFLTAGNPNLRKSTTNYIDILYNIPLEKYLSQFSVSSRIEFTSDAIVNKKTFYSTPSTLEHFGYPVKPGTTVSTFENCAGSWSADVEIRYTKRLQKIGSTITGICSVHRSQTPYFKTDELVFVNYVSPKLSVNAQIRPSKNINSTVYCSIGMLEAKDSLSGVLTKTINGHLGISGTYNIGKHFFIKARYSLSDNHLLLPSTNNITYQYLATSVGIKLMKSRLRISLSGNDLLNRGSSYSVIAAEDYTRESWIPSYGRYYLITASFRLNKLKPTTKFQGTLSNGSDNRVGITL